ncbi:hypothetical protein CBA19CS22_28345 [Caballeronia novacaledonica]|uniref:Uncharacterized protein n=1 Tax=Caballeronia novacaledonica TaxID=1544861 RepID=A0ACB5QZU7_9BURK|nr:hypothetical protein CBA19CS22_28345 [Caballeronia novacaledonica]
MKIIDAQRGGSLMYLALLVLSCVFMRHALTNAASFALYQDNESMLGPLLGVLSNALSHGLWPLRTDTFLGGMALYDLPQLSAFYPFYMTWLPIYQTPFESMHSMHWVTLFHVLLAAANMCVLLRTMDRSVVASVFGSILFAFSANMLVYSSWLNILAPYAWLPLYLAGLIGILAARPRRIYPVIALLGMVMLVLSSPAQPLIHAVLLTSIMTVARLASAFATSKNVASLKPLMWVIGLGIISVLLVAPVLGPTIWNLSGTIRWIGPYPAIIGNAPVPFEAFQHDQMSIQMLGGVLFKMKNLAVGNPFVGPLVVALAAAGATLGWRSWLVKAMAFVALYSLISAAGSNLGFAYVNYYMPLLNKIREPSRFIVLFQLAMVLLAATGLDEMHRVLSAVPRPNLGKLVLPLIAVTGISVLVGYFVRGSTVQRLSTFATVVLLAALVLLTWFSAKSSNRTAASSTRGAWALVSLALLGYEVPWAPQPLTTSQYLTENGVSLNAALERVTRLDPTRQYRVIFEGSVKKQQASMMAAYYNIRTLNAYINPAPYRLFDELYYQAPRPDSYFANLGVKYLLCQDCTPAATRGFRHLEDVDNIAIYEAVDVAPRAWLASTVAGSYGDVKDFQTKLGTHPVSEGVLYVRAEDERRIGTSIDATPGCFMRETTRTITYDRFESSCAGNRLLVLNEFNDKAWRAYVDGALVPIIEVNANQLGVHLTAGLHFVEFRYRPDVFVYGLYLFACGLLLAILYVVRYGTMALRACGSDRDR